MREVIATTLFFTTFLMMLTPIIVIALGFTGVKMGVEHVVIGVTGLVLFFLLPAIGLYGDES